MLCTEGMEDADIDGRVWAVGASLMSVPRCQFLMTRSWELEQVPYGGGGCILQTFRECWLDWFLEVWVMYKMKQLMNVLK